MVEPIRIANQISLAGITSVSGKIASDDKDTVFIISDDPPDPPRETSPISESPPPPPDPSSPSTSTADSGGSGSTKHPYKYVCPFCGKSYTSRSGLLSHKNTIHYKRKPYRCQLCNEHFFTSAQRVAHIHKKHAAEGENIEATVMRAKTHNKRSDSNETVITKDTLPAAESSPPPASSAASGLETPSGIRNRMSVSVITPVAKPRPKLDASQPQQYFTLRRATGSTHIEVEAVSLAHEQNIRPRQSIVLEQNDRGPQSIQPVAVESSLPHIENVSPSKRLVDEEDDPFSSLICPKVDFTKSHDRRPQNIAESRDVGGAEYGCVECGLACQSVGELLLHLKVHEGNKGNVPPDAVQCYFCDNYVSEQDLSLHLLRSHCQTQEERSKESSCLCSLCGKMFETEAWKDIHVKYQHPGEGGGKGAVRHACSCCPAAFADSATLDAHSNYECRVSLRCTYCQQPFPSASVLLTHCKIAHDDITTPLKSKADSKVSAASNMSCPLCEFATGDQDAYAWHISAQHKQVETVSCPTCRHTTKSFSSMLSHLRTEHGVDKETYDVWAFNKGSSATAVAERSIKLEVEH